MPSIKTLIVFMLSAMLLILESNPVGASGALRLIVSPNPVKAPSKTTFIVVSAQKIPSTIELQFQRGHPVVLHLKKEAPHDYAASYFIRSSGQLQVNVRNQSHQIILHTVYKVSNSPTNLVGALLIVVLFFVVSIWYWRKSQRRYQGSPKR